MSPVFVVAMVFLLLGILWGSESTGLLTSRTHNHKSKTFLPKSRSWLKAKILLLSHSFSSTVFKYNVPRRLRDSVSVQGLTEYIGLHNKWCAYGFDKIIFTDLQSTLQNILTFISALEA